MEVLMVFGKKEINIHAVLFKPFHETWHSEPVIRHKHSPPQRFFYFIAHAKINLYSIYTVTTYKKWGNQT